MKDLNLIDIEEKIYTDLKTSCDINQEALDYIKNNLSQISSFGNKEEEEIKTTGKKTIKDIKSYSLASTIPLIKDIVELFNKTNINSLSSSSLVNAIPFHSPYKQHNKNLKKTEKLYNELLKQKQDYDNALEFFDNIQKKHITNLEKIDKSIFLGKCIYHLLSKEPEKNIKNLTTLQNRIFQMEITKNIPLQIISKIQGTEEILTNLLILIDRHLSPDFSLYISKYKEGISSLKEKKKFKKLDKLLSLYQNILRDIKTLEIIDEDLYEKFQDLKDFLPHLIS